MKLRLLLALLLAPCALLHADSVRLRPVEFRTVAVAYVAEGKPATFDLRYADLLRQVVLSPSPGGASADEVVKTVELWAPFKRAIEAGEPRVLLNEADYQALLVKLNAFRWSPQPDLAETVAQFIAYARGIPATDFEASPAKK